MFSSRGSARAAVEAYRAEEALRALRAAEIAQRRYAVAQAEFEAAMRGANAARNSARQFAGIQGHPITRGTESAFQGHPFARGTEYELQGHPMPRGTEGGRLCWMFVETGSCRFGAHCRYEHRPAAHARRRS